MSSMSSLKFLKKQESLQKKNRQSSKGIGVMESLIGFYEGAHVF